MPALPTIPTISDGVLTSSQLNQFGSAISFLFRPPIAKMRQTTLQTITTGTITAITFTTEDFDDDIDGTGGHDNSSNTSRFTARYPGRYAAAARVNWAAGTTGRRMTGFQVNGVGVNGGRYFITATASILNPTFVVTTYLASGDYLEVVGFHEQGANLNTEVGTVDDQSIFNVWWVSS